MSKSRIVLLVAAIVALLGIVVIMGNRNSGVVMPTQSTGNNQLYIFKTATSTRLGQYLVSGNGMSLYVYAKDMAGLSTCVDQCTESWTPYVLPSLTSLIVESSVKGSISTLKRSDGSEQLTYNGSPLYLWNGDKKPGDILGQNVNGVWSVIKP